MIKTLKTSLFLISVVLGLIQVLINRFYMAQDGVPYLDMADAYLRGDWHTAINGYWNPLYAWIVGADLFFLHPSPYWEYPSVQLVNLLIYIGTIFAFEYFLSGLVEKYENPGAIRIVAYAIFWWTSFELIRVWMVNADMLVAASIYLAFGILLRQPAKWTSIALGAILAFGYYAKAVMFPVGLMVLGLAWVIFSRRQAVLACAVFFFLCLPWITVLSEARGHLTFGDTGRLNYSWYVNGVESRHWEGGPDRAGHPLHPARVVLDSPRVYEFNGPMPVTYPIWYDESYWYEGLHLWIEPRLLVRVALRNVAGVAKLVFLQGGGFLIGALVCFLFQKERGVLLRPGRHWVALWTLNLAAIFLYCLVHTEPRLLGPFVAVLFVIPLMCVYVEKQWVATGIALFGLAWAACFASVTTAKGERFTPWDRTPRNISWQIATGLEGLGLAPGDKVSVTTDGGGLNSRWARLAKVHIVAEMDYQANFWKLTPAEQQHVLAALSASGEKMAVSATPPPDSEIPAGWQPIGSTNYYVYKFSNTQASGNTQKSTKPGK
jgi:hypothetical protein